MRAEHLRAPSTSLAPHWPLPWAPRAQVFRGHFRRRMLSTLLPAATLPSRVTEVFAALDAACSAPRRTRAEEKRATTPFRLFGIAAHEAQVEAYMQVARAVASRSASPSTLVCEVGFNCGHSSAAFLEADEKIHVLNFDLPYYSWATAGRNFMRERYGSRIRVIAEKMT